MKIVIAGAGEVGTHLAKMLSKEKHDIILMDEDSEKLHQISSHIDLLTVTGYANSIRDLQEAGTQDADLFIAVTPFEDRNIVACLIAKDLGAKRTVARVNNGEFLNPHNRARFTKFGVDEIIYPENLAAKEIVNSIKQVGTREMIEFSGGKLILMGIKVRGNAPIVNRTMEDISLTDEAIRTVAISRENKVFIPRGKSVILNGDIVFFITNKANKDQIFNLCGKKIYEIKNIMILGGSRIAQKAVEKLGDQYHIKIIEYDRDRSIRLAGKLRNALVIHGDGRNMELLKEESLEKMDAFVAVTGNSETNILSCQLAKSIGVKRTIAEIENIDFLNMAEEMGIGSIINKKLLAASYIYKYTMGTSVSQVKCLTASDADVFEFEVKNESKITSKPLRELSFPEDAIVGGVIRGDKGFVATGDTQIKIGDLVVVFALTSAISKIEKFFN
ncbi:MAG: Trk system potassium transporter TrkA [Bacteroidota bacterium]|nr:Trk system potassium transporter TrkA [Odoribacter sp.]MDP3643946.1 Trk system potassium transporter TrkA [Bacteroidota bacterium]